MKSIIILAATVACAYSYALVSLPPNYKEKYPDLFKNGRQPRDLSSALEKTKDSDQASTDHSKEQDKEIVDVDADADEDTEKTEEMPRHPIEFTPKEVEIKVSSPNVSTDRPKSETEVTTEKQDDDDDDDDEKDSVPAERTAEESEESS